MNPEAKHLKCIGADQKGSHLYFIESFLKCDQFER
jgi:hypothetical protein